eukprot:m.52791 g.52791  ORF g.52791 m.52791 type:complete len:406 (-) comp21658_c0_seq1:80-1297(-)
MNEGRNTRGASGKRRDTRDTRDASGKCKHTRNIEKNPFGGANPKSAGIMGWGFQARMKRGSAGIRFSKRANHTQNMYLPESVTSPENGVVHRSTHMKDNHGRSNLLSPARMVSPDTRSNGYVYDEFRVCDKCHREDYGVLPNSEGVYCCFACDQRSLLFYSNSHLRRRNDQPNYREPDSDSMAYSTLSPDHKNTTDGDRATPNLSNPKSSKLKSKARAFRTRVRKAFRHLFLTKHDRPGIVSLPSSHTTTISTTSASNEVPDVEKNIEVFVDDVIERIKSKMSVRQGVFGRHGLLVDTNKAPLSMRCPEMSMENTLGDVGDIAEDGGDTVELFGQVTVDDCVVRAVYTHRDNVIEDAYREQTGPAEHMWSLMGLPVRNDIARCILDEFDCKPDPNFEFQISQTEW